MRLRSSRSASDSFLSSLDLICKPQVSTRHRGVGAAVVLFPRYRRVIRGRDVPESQGPGSLTTVTKNSPIWRTTSRKRSKSTGLVTYAFACRS